MQQAWTDILVSSFQEVVHRLSTVTPRLLAMLTLVLVGWIVAIIARRVAVRVLTAADVDARCARSGLMPTWARAGVLPSPTVLVGQVVFWILLLMALLMGVEALELPATAGLVALVLRFLPNLVVAGLVMIAGWVLANFLSQAALIGAVNAQVAGAPLIAGAVRWLVLVFAGAAALTQLGIAREMVLLAFGIAFGGTVLALAVAFGLGGKELAREILESRLRKQDEEGDHMTQP
jgi:hypothetical protein